MLDRGPGTGYEVTYSEMLDRGPGAGYEVTYSDGLEILMSELLAGEAARPFSIPSSSGMLPCRVLMSLLA